MVGGEHNGETGIALENGETKREIKIRLTSGPNSGRVVKVISGDYMTK